MKNILKKFVVLLSLGFVLFGFNFTFAVNELPVPPVCEPPQILNDTNDVCVDSAPVVITCEEPKTIVDGVCKDPTPEKLKEQVVIRNGDVVLYNDFYELPEQETILIPDKEGVSHEIDARSVIAILYGIDSISDNFSISTLEYNSTYSSLYMKCLTPNGEESLCDNWQYVVNGSYPYVGMDKNILTGNEKIHIYFGQQNRVLLNKDSIKDNEELSVTAEKYDYENNLWLVRNGVTIGVTKPDPENPWSPNDEIQKMVDETTGIAYFLSVPEGEYNVGVKEDYYWPTEKLIVTKFIPESDGGSSGGSSPSTPVKTFSVSKALEFLVSNQESDGSFGDAMYTDWVAIAVGVGDSQSLESSLATYLKSNPLDSDVVTDYERRAMALMALGINPYNGTDVNYIKKIVDSFDGMQFGDKDLINDDIFALIVLKNAGYGKDDDIIRKDISYIIDGQINGSWGSIDMTGAGIQALRGFESVDGVPLSLLDAKNYIVLNQRDDGGFDNTSSTSWALQSSYNDIQNKKAESYLALKQQIDGGLENITDDTDMRVWATAYAIPAILHKSWSSILDNFPKQIVATSNTISNTEEIKKEIIVPLVVKEEKNNEEIIPKIENKKVVKPIVKISTIKNTKVEKTESEILKEDKTEGNPLSASALGSTSRLNNNFSYIVHNIIGKIKAPFIWFLSLLGF